MRNKPQVLVIDDERNLCFLLKKALTREGYQVFTAQDGMAGLEIVRKRSPDIVLVDLKMPQMDGIEVLRSIKKFNDEIVVVMITGYGTMDTARMAMKLGAFDYVTKPIDIEYLNTIIKDGLGLTLRAL